MSPNSSSGTINQQDIRGESIGFLGDTFFRPEDDQTTFLHKDSLLQESILIYQTDTTDLNSIIWYGRRLAAMYRFKDAITIFSSGIKRHPEAPELYRHRGQMYIITRHLDQAITDFNKAADLSRDRLIETEPDAIPNKLDLPLTNLRFNIYYHLGVAWYLKGDDAKAIDAFKLSQPYAINPDLTVAASFWLYHSLLRLGKETAADSLLNTLSPYAEIFENEAFIKALLMYKLAMSESSDSMVSKADSLNNTIELYGVTNWMMMHDHQTEASSIRRRILVSGDWIDIGYIAAEADSSRLRVH